MAQHPWEETAMSDNCAAELEEILAG